MNSTQTPRSLRLSKSKSRLNQVIDRMGRSFLLTVTSLSMIAVVFIFLFVIKDAMQFLTSGHLWEFFTSSRWYPAAGDKAEYGALSIFYGTLSVTVGASIVAIPLGVAAAVCLSDVLPFKVRQIVKPCIEMLAAIPSVAYGFFALVLFAPLLQTKGGPVLGVIFLLVSIPITIVINTIISELIADRAKAKEKRRGLFIGSFVTLGVLTSGVIYYLWQSIHGLEISSGTNSLNVSLILGMMALPTIVSVSEDALQSCGRDLREGSYALGATRAETICKVVIPAAMSGIFAAILLGVMRAIGETMVVWMASGNTAAIPEPFYNMLEPVRTLTASIAGDMGEAARGTLRYSVLFTMALCLLIISFTMNWLSQMVVNRQRRKLGK